MWKARDPGGDPAFDFQIKKLGTEKGSNLPKVIQRVHIDIETQPGAACQAYRELCWGVNAFRGSRNVEGMRPGLI